MNWTGGRLQRHSGKRAGALTAAQKRYFAKARSNIKTSALQLPQDSITQSAPLEFARNNDSYPRPKGQKTRLLPDEADISDAILPAKRKINELDDEDLVHVSTQKSPPGSVWGKTGTENAFGSAKHTDFSRRTGQALALDEESNIQKKQRLLSYGDWVGPPLIEPVTFKFPDSESRASMARRRKVVKKQAPGKSTGRTKNFVPLVSDEYVDCASPFILRTGTNGGSGRQAKCYPESVPSTHDAHADLVSSNRMGSELLDRSPFDEIQVNPSQLQDLGERHGHISSSHHLQCHEDGTGVSTPSSFGRGQWRMLHDDEILTTPSPPKRKRKTQDIRNPQEQKTGYFSNPQDFRHTLSRESGIPSSLGCTNGSDGEQNYWQMPRDLDSSSYGCISDLPKPRASRESTRSGTSDKASGLNNKTNILKEPVAFEGHGSRGKLGNSAGVARKGPVLPQNLFDDGFPIEGWSRHVEPDQYFSESLRITDRNDVGATFTPTKLLQSESPAPGIHSPTLEFSHRGNGPLQPSTDNIPSRKRTEHLPEQPVQDTCEDDLWRKFVFSNEPDHDPIGMDILSRPAKDGRSDEFLIERADIAGAK